MRGRFSKTHGMSGTREYDRWSDMKSRCYNPASTSYSRYGGRGIKVCDRWLDSFPAFLGDMGRCPDGMSLEREDYNGDYAPENCRWATATEQSNNRRSNARITHDGTTLTISQWATKLGINQHTLRDRLHRYNMPPSRALLRDVGRPSRKPMSRETKAKIGAANRARFLARRATA